MKLYLSFHNPHLRDSFNYVTKTNLLNNGSHHSLSCTTNRKEERDGILFPSGYDYCYEYQEAKDKDRVYIIALSDPDDLNFHKGIVTLTSDAINAYQKADVLLVHSEEQKDFLTLAGFAKEKIEVIPLEPTYSDTKILESERNSFRSFYQIPNDRKLILLLGNDFNRNDIKKMEELAMLSPEKCFLCFGRMDMASIKEKRREMLGFSTNIRFFDVIPEELYRSATLTSDCILLYSNPLCPPPVLYDFHIGNAKIVSYTKTGYNRELLQKMNTQFIKDFPSLHHYISSL